MRYWIDALCISQADMEERNHQVKRMVEIYGQARAVVAWLGDSSEACDSAIDSLYDAARNR